MSGKGKDLMSDLIDDDQVTLSNNGMECYFI